MKADELSTNNDSMQNHVSEDQMEANICVIDIHNLDFTEQLLLEQQGGGGGAIIRSAKLDIESGAPVQEGQLKRVAKQLRIEHGALTYLCL